MENTKSLVEDSLSWLGLRVGDKLTTFTGIISSISFDVSGCIQGYVRPEECKDGKMAEGYWLDLNRLEILSPNQIIKPCFHGIEMANKVNGPENKTDPSMKVL